MVTKRSKDGKPANPKPAAVPANAQPRGKHAAHAASQTPAGGQPVRQPSAAPKAPVQPAHPSAAQAAPKQPTQRSFAQPPKTVKAQASHGSRSTRSSKPAKPTKQKQRRIPLPAKIVLSVLLVAAIAAAAFLVWDYLFRYDDAADFQGQWKIEGSNASIVITEDEIRLTDSVSFTYELNTFEKTIKYEFANYSGEGMYVFSPERDVLTLTDVSPSPDEGDTQQSMSLLKVSSQAIGEPEVANNNTAGDASTTGADVIEGTESAQQAEESEQ